MPLVLALFLQICVYKTEAFLGGSGLPRSVHEPSPCIYSVDRCGLTRIARPSKTWCHNKNKRRSWLILFEKVPKDSKDRSASSESSNVKKQQQKSVIQSFFADKNPPDPSEPPDEAAEKMGSSWIRNFFRRNKKEEVSEEEKKPRKSSSSRGQGKQNDSINKKTSNIPKRKNEKQVKSDNLRRQALVEQLKQVEKFGQQQQQQPQQTQIKTFKSKQGAGTKKKEKDVSSSSTSPQQSMLNRFSSWLPGGAGADNDTSDDNSSSSSTNSTNPLSAFQQFWQHNKSKRDEEWIDVIPKTRLSPGEVVPVTVGGLDLLIIAGLMSDNRIYAIENSCPHLGTPLEIGQLVRLPKENESPPLPSSSSSSSAANAGSASSEVGITSQDSDRWTELQVSSILQQDGCEDCIVCPLHKTAFALESGQVRGEWCPYPPIVGKLTGLVKDPTPVATFDVRVRKKSIQVRLNSLLPPDITSPKKK